MFSRSKKYNLLTYLLIFILLAFNCSKNESPTKPNNKPIEKEIDFIKTFGGSKNESARSAIKTLDGGYAILGFTQSGDGDILNKTNESFDYLLLKYSQDHILQWQKTYGGSDDDRGSDIIKTSDGGYAILGSSKSNDGDVSENNGFNDFWLLKSNSFGDIIWEKTFGFSGADDGLSIIQTQDAGFLIVGVLDVTASAGQGNTKLSSKRHAGGDYWAIKLNSTGTLQWSKYFGGTFTDTPYDVIQTDDNGYIIVGSSDSTDVDIKNNKGSYDFWIIKISEIGELVWEKSFGGSQADEARGIVKTNDGNYLIIGDTRSEDTDVSLNKGAADFWIIKMSPNGDLIWEKTFGGSSFDAARSVSKTQDGGFIICGSSRSANVDLNNNYGQNDAWVIKIDNNGNIIWQKSIGGTEVDLAYDAIELNDNSVIIIGESSSSNLDITENKGFSDLLIFKTK
ncbi:hypothetical protein [Seonamhaeicola aphaedonensis]|uniref:Bulb-type lectin domain-containing protein n=1 Tax=Seonamhaeicola aphaedonensis TaxID=1461338 RepID=A0A3D9HLV4_9FLAO|nr:hypothetical protein [Seonamhaeicola aphaedonensis]RED50454.1 hypothetical protein DFQ02_101486 [Seonamhaeicola aphaedonensis]